MSITFVYSVSVTIDLFKDDGLSMMGGTIRDDESNQIVLAFLNMAILEGNKQEANFSWLFITRYHTKPHKKLNESTSAN